MNRRQLLVGAGAITGAAALGALVPSLSGAPKHKRFIDLRYTQMDPDWTDSIVIERIQGSPARKVFIIEVGDMPKARIDAHLREVAQEIACRVIA